MQCMITLSDVTKSNFFFFCIQVWLLAALLKVLAPLSNIQKKVKQKSELLKCRVKYQSSGQQWLWEGDGKWDKLYQDW